MNKNLFNNQLQKIKDKLSKDPEKHNYQETIDVLTDYTNELNNIADKMRKKNTIMDKSINDIIILFSKNMYNILDDIIILFSKKKYKVYSKWLKDKKYNKWWIPIIAHIQILWHIFTKKDRMMYSGMLMIFLSICFYFMGITK